MGRCPLGLGHWEAPPAPRGRVAAEREGPPGRQLRSHLLRGRRRPPQCLFTNQTVRERNTAPLPGAPRPLPAREEGRAGDADGDPRAARSQRVSGPPALAHLHPCAHPKPAREGPPSSLAPAPTSSTYDADPGNPSICVNKDYRGWLTRGHLIHLSYGSITACDRMRILQNVSLVQVPTQLRNRLSDSPSYGQTIKPGLKFIHGKKKIILKNKIILM